MEIKDLVSVSEIAKMAKVDEQTADQWSKSDPRFPNPTAQPASGNLYSLKAVQKWSLESGHSTIPITL